MDNGESQHLNRIQLIVILGALSAFGPLSLDMYLPSFPDLQSDFGVEKAMVTITLSSCLLGLAAGQLFAGPISDRTGRRGPLLIGMAGYAIASVLCAIAPTIWFLIAVRFVQGFAGAAGLVIARAIVRDLYSGRDAAKFFSRLMLISGLAPIMAPLIGGQILRFTDWRGIFWLLAVIGLVLCLTVLFFLPETLHPEQRRNESVTATFRLFGLLMRDKVFMGYVLAAGFAGAALFSWIGNSSFVVQDVYGLSEQAFSVTFSLNAIGYMFFGQLNGRLVGSYPVRKLLAVGLAGSTLGSLYALLVALTGSKEIALIVPGLVLAIGLNGFTFPNTSALAMTRYPKMAGTASALLGVTQFIIGAVTAPLTGLVDSDTAVPMLLSMVLLGTIAFLSFAILTRADTAEF